MVKALALILLAIEVGAGFGSASADLISTSSNAMEVDLRVSVTRSAETVIAHLVFEDEPEITLPLIQRESGVFGLRTELKPVNYRVVFEIIGPDPARSDPHSLMELGLDAGSEAVDTTTTTIDEEAMSEENRSWLWLAAAFAAAALSALAFWVLGGEDQPSSDASTDDGADDFA